MFCICVMFQCRSSERSMLEIYCYSNKDFNDQSNHFLYFTFTDTYLRLVDSTGTEVAFNDDFCDFGAGSQISYTNQLTPGCANYTLREGCFQNTTCSGTVAVYEPPPTPQPTPAPTVKGQVVCPFFDAYLTNSDTVNYTTCNVYLCGGDTVMLSTCEDTSGYGDTYLRLFDSMGTQVAYNDDYCGYGGYGSQITYTVPDDMACATYAIREG